MDKVSVILSFVLALAMMILAFPEGFAASLVSFLFSALLIILIRRSFDKDRNFLVNLFIYAALARISFGLILHLFDLRDIFGGDAITYHSLGNRLYEIWIYDSPSNDNWSQKALATTGSGWGMSKLVGALYVVTGPNILAAQSLCAVAGAATIPLVYNCSKRIFHNSRVGRVSALIVAFYPAFIVWTGQLLKDGLIVLLLVLCMSLVLRLQEKFRYFDIILLIISMFGIISLRFYIFYMAALAVVGAFLLGTKNSPIAIARRFAVLVLLGLGLTYFGVLRNAGSEIDEYANLERIQMSRKDLANRADSGFGEDLDVSTTQGALSAIPIGFVYLMFAPFPWQLASSRSFLSLPDILIWWASVPFLIIGLAYTIKNQLRRSVPILVFSLMLTLSYSIFSGNVGTAYRQRVQIQVFLFMFIAVGWTLREEKRENQKLIAQERSGKYVIYEK